ncbi:MAG TPA: carboxymuconolactone decarboxylase family protein [Candidatus Acidoferrales bacterium]|nr:carboxymuconolactone decarboxylase family protein [Candidatus Acidoferrales bacterium]
MNHPIAVFPEAFRALQALGKVAHNGAVPSRTLMLAELRASQINGCSVCVSMHAGDLKKNGESDERIFAVAAWRENPAFDPAERAALALTEELTRISDRADPVSDAVWTEAARHYDERGLATLILAIANINTWNRLNVAIRQVVGTASA